MKRARIVGVIFFAFLLGVRGLLSCKERGGRAGDSSVKIANAPDKTSYLNSLPADRRAAAVQLLQATAFLTMTRSDGSISTCTGTVISKVHVLTAAHCLRSVDKKRMAGPSEISIEVLVGGYTYAATVLFVAEGYKPQGGDYHNDAAVLVVQQGFDLTYPSRLTPVSIASNKLQIIAPKPGDPRAPYNLEKGWVAGYGRIQAGSQLGSGELRIKPTEYEPTSDKKPGDSHINITVEGAHTVQSREDLNRVSGVPCPGDSGGPSVLVRNGAPVIIGVTSYFFGGDCLGVLGYKATDVRTIDDLQKKLSQWAKFTDGVQSAAIGQPSVTPVPQPQRPAVTPPVARQQVCGFRWAQSDDAEDTRLCQNALAEEAPGRVWAGIRRAKQPIYRQGQTWTHQCLTYGPGDPSDNDACYR